MMTKMRENTAVILWILVLAFVATIVFSWGMGGFDSNGQTTSTVVGTVNGQDLDIRRFEQLVANRVNNQQREPDDAAIRTARGSAWDDMVSLSLAEQELDRLDLQPRDTEILDWVTWNPPAFFTTDTSFQTNGRFDTTIWIDRLIGNPEFGRSIENYVRSSYPYQKLYSRIYATATVSDADLRDKFMSDNRTASARYLAFPSKALPIDSSAIDENRLKAWYDEHREEYRDTEKRLVEYVQFTAQPSAEDSADALDQANYILKQLAAGDDFGALARTFSADASNAEKGGDLGWFEKGRMVPEFGEAAFAAEIGSVVGPIQTRFGWHLIKVNGHEMRENDKGEKTDQVSAQHILLKVEVSSMTYSDLRSKVDGFVEECRNGGEFKSVAEARGLMVLDSNPLSRDRMAPGLGRNQRALDLIFAAGPGEIVDPIFSKANGWFVYRLTKIIPEGLTPFADVRDKVYAKVADADRVNEAFNRAQEWMGMHSGITSLDSTMAVDGILYTETPSPVKINSGLRNIGRDMGFSLALFSMEAGQLRGPVRGDMGAYVIQCLSIDSIDSLETVFASRLPQLREDGFTTARNNAYGNWSRITKDNARIDDRRVDFGFDY
ncbi:MAG: peptidylprolyl isomerase [Candidatus Cloacimonetes bacterium]|nr:peptidylprolyl isomerase [Candidatus Cloacimonadota bacterium]